MPVQLPPVVQEQPPRTEQSEAAHRLPQYPHSNPLHLRPLHRDLTLPALHYEVVESVRRVGSLVHLPLCHTPFQSAVLALVGVMPELHGPVLLLRHKIQGQGSTSRRQISPRLSLLPARYRELPGWGMVYRRGVRNLQVIHHLEARARRSGIRVVSIGGHQVPVGARVRICQGLGRLLVQRG
jgi:hypothetical protein